MVVLNLLKTLNAIILFLFISLVLKSWQIFLAITSIPSFLSGSLVLFLPESPKFLMSTGRNKEALIVFQKIFTWNTGKSYKEYPVCDKIQKKKLTYKIIKSHLDNTIGG